MSKRAKKAAQKIFRPIDKGVVNLVTKQELIDFQNLRMEQKRQYIAGYEQAEKDLILTANDVKNIFNRVRNEQIKHSATEGCYQEVADWFNKQRNDTRD